MAFLFGAALGLVLGVALVMVFARLENARAEQRRELVRACRTTDPIPGCYCFIFLEVDCAGFEEFHSSEFYPSWVSFTQKQKLSICQC
ncbi:hypothetical protein PR202_gb03579 [Eleusine coracana subsp. coracana]|uniref:Uncharacterized protein n=1 Tax=Eleusine coracana subsp. coracana TaxID=191504 RepID=A0AAV5E210_ELECO|nr:hypothetical protein PR202_gb03579 [Eleusine coracana subsp. coracana]